MRALKIFTAIIFILSSFASPALAQKKIFINSASRLMLFYDDDTKLAVYHLGLGKVSTPTPPNTKFLPVPIILWAIAGCNFPATTEFTAPIAPKVSAVMFQTVAYA